MNLRFILGFIYRSLLWGSIVFSIFIFFSDIAALRFNTADGSLYLNIAENIVKHQGFVVSFNLCQCFKGLYHPIWAYYQPLYPLFVSLFLGHGGIVQVIKANILLFAFNMALILYIVRKLVPTRLNILFLFFLVFSFNCFFSALYPWTEQLHFFCFIVTFILFLKFKDYPKHLLWLGALNGIFMLVRVAHLYNFLAYLPVIFIGKDPLAQKLKRAFCFAGAFILIYGLYQLFCLLSYHTFYPEYARPGASYGMARLYSGTVYDLNKVGIQVALGPFFSSQHLLYIGQHLRAFYVQMPFFLWPALFYYFLPVKKRVEGGLIELCFFQIILTVLGYSLTFYWLPSHFESSRYSMIPYVLISVVGWYCLYQGLSLSQSILKKLLGLLVLICLFFGPQTQKIVEFRNNVFTHPYSQNGYYKDLFASYDWIDKNLPKEILVASDEDQQGHFMHRPYISTPVGRSYNCTNLALFNRIYSPDYYLLSSMLSDRCFEGVAHTKVFSNRTFRILKVVKGNK